MNPTLPAARNLARVFKGLLAPAQILDSPRDCLAYSYDASGFQGAPLLILLPSSVAQSLACVKLCAENNVAFVARGAGTNLAGASVAGHGEIVISLTRLNRIQELDVQGRRALVECGVVNLDLQKAAGARGLMFAPDPASQKASTLGGNISLNSGGPRCLKHGITTHHMLALEAVLPDGSRGWFGDPLAEGLGPDLRGLLVGAEGALGLVTRAWLRLVPVARAARTALLSFQSLQDAVQATSAIIGAGIVPSALELMDAFVLEAIEQFIHAGYPRDAQAVLLAEVEGDPEELDEMMEALAALARRHGCGEVRVAAGEEERTRLWEGRRGAHAAVSRLRPSVCVEDGTVPRTRLAEAVQALQEIARQEGLQMGTLCHAGDGNFHPLIVYDERDPGERAKVHAAGMEMLKVCAALGGTITGEHGVGLEKLEVVENLFEQDTLEIMGSIKNLVDPQNLSNPGKFIPPKYVHAPARPEALPAAVSGEDEEWKPGNAAEAREMVREAASRGRKLLLQGGDSKRVLTDFHGIHLSLLGLDRVLDYDPKNLTLEAEAGLSLARAEALAAKDGLRLPFAGSYPGRATLGGAVSCSDSGPFRGAWGSIRDALLGMESVLADGRALRCGRKVVKNVAGLDLPKLWVGSRGAYGLITRLLFKLQPRPEARHLLIFEEAGLPEAREGLAALRAQGLEPAAFTLANQGYGRAGVWVDLEGRHSTASSRLEAARRLLAGLLKEKACLEGPDRDRAWEELRSPAVPEGGRLVRLWVGPGQIGQPYEAAGREGIAACLHLPSGELLAAPGPGQALWPERNLGPQGRFSVLQGAPGALGKPLSLEGELALKIKKLLDPRGVFPGLLSYPTGPELRIACDAL